MRVDDERSEAGRITIRLDEDIYNQITEKSKIYYGGSFSGYVHCAIAYNLALDDMGVSPKEFAAASYRKSHDFGVHSGFRIGGRNLGLTEVEYKQALVQKHYKSAIKRLQK